MNLIPAHRRLTRAKLIRFVVQNPGMTAAMISLCLRRKWGTVSSMLSKLAKAEKIDRVEARGMRGVERTWRYYAAGTMRAKLTVKMPTLAEQVEAVEKKADALAFLAGQMVATLEVNRKRKTLRSDDDQYFDKLVASWRRELNSL